MVPFDPGRHQSPAQVNTHARIGVTGERAFSYGAKKTERGPEGIAGHDVAAGESPPNVDTGGGA
jgi:hypothetical protein